MIPRRPNPSLITTYTADQVKVPAGLPSPSEFGLPERFREFRPGQWQGMETIVDSPQRFIVVCAPTGFGKSIMSVAAAILSNRRTVLLCSTKGLQTQYTDTLGDIVSDVRGQGNFTCPIASSLGLSARTTVSEAPCQCGYPCMLRRAGGCEYFDGYRQAQRAPLVITNYQAWFYDALKGPEALHVGPVEYKAMQETGANERDSRVPVDMLVCDEVDLAQDELGRFVGVQISCRECIQLKLSWPREGGTIDDWREWAGLEHKDVARRVAVWQERLKTGSSNGASSGAGWSREFKLLREIERKLARLATIHAEDDWIMDERQATNDAAGSGGDGGLASVRFEPLSPARYAEQALWRGVEKIVLMSATVRPKTAELLGIRPEEMRFVEYPSSFDKRRRPIIVVPSVMLNYRTEQQDDKMRLWLDRLDAIIATRLNRKGLIHAVSYSRAKFIKDNSVFGRYMIIHNSHDRADKVEEFRQAEAPAILVSPSVGTGYDFNGDQARWVVIAKLPFASVNDPVIRARQDRDREYNNFLTAQAIVQSCGRAMRSADDWAETIILDDAFGNWFYPRAKKFLMGWWIEALVWAVGVPEPMAEPVELVDMTVDEKEEHR